METIHPRISSILPLRSLLSSLLSSFLAILILSLSLSFSFFLRYYQLHARLNSLSDQGEYPDINFYRFSPRGSALCTSSFYFMTRFIPASVHRLRFLFLSMFGIKFLMMTNLYSLWVFDFSHFIHVLKIFLELLFYTSLNIIKENLNRKLLTKMIELSKLSKYRQFTEFH